VRSFKGNDEAEVEDEWLRLALCSAHHKYKKNKTGSFLCEANID
jgi:hypothetical protein